MIKILLISLATISLFAYDVQRDKTLTEDQVQQANALYKSCIGCHGIEGKKEALGKSKRINEMSKDELVLALEGYKDGSYGGAMKGVMKGQVVRLSTEEIEILSDYISTL